MSYKFELAFRQYISAFDGNNEIAPGEFQSRFDNVYHKDFTLRPSKAEDSQLPKSKEPLNRDEVFQFHSNILAAGTKVSLIHFRKIGLDCIDYKLLLEKDKEVSTVRVVVTITANGQAVLSKEIDESRALTEVMGAQCANFAYKYQELGTYGTNM